MRIKKSIALSHKESLEKLSVSENDKQIVTASIPETCMVTTENAEDLLQRPKTLFFKPVAGFGGRAKYRGDKLTKRVWNEFSWGLFCTAVDSTQ